MAPLWLARIDGGPKKVNHTAVLVGKDIYCFGGISGNLNILSDIIDVFVLCTATNRWRQLDPPTDPEELACMPNQRFGHSAVTYENKVYIWGGKDKTLNCNTLFCFDTVTQKWSRPAVTGPIPLPREGHTACVIDNKMYIYGGFSDQMNDFTSGVEAIDLTTMTWSAVESKGDKPAFRDFHSAVAVDGKMYVFGGRGGSQEPFIVKEEIYENYLFIFDPKTNFWEKRSSALAPIGRRSLGMAASGKKIYIFGGYNALEHRYYNDLHCYDVELDEWSGEIKTQGLKPCERRRHCTIIVNNRMYVFGGTSSIARYYSDFQIAFQGRTFNNDQCCVSYDDLHILELNPTLTTLSLVTVIKHKLDLSALPGSLQREVEWLTKKNTITRSASDKIKNVLLQSGN